VILGVEVEITISLRRRWPWGLPQFSPRVPPPAASPSSVIPGDDLETLIGETLRDGAAHTAQPDKPDFH
jgi:hypothetical protein